MYREIVIGEKTVPMMCTALTPKTAYEFFNQDFLSVIGKDLDGGQLVDLAEKLGFVMAMRAADRDMKKLQESDFDKWLDGLEFGDLMEAASEIVGLYVATTKPKIVPK